MDAAVVPSLDATTHPYVELVSTDQAIYAPDSAAVVSGKVLITLRNLTASPFEATITTSIYRDATLVQRRTNRVSIPITRSILVPVAFGFSDQEEQGYRIDVAIKDDRGAAVDEAPGAIDVQTSRIASRFPRQCWVSHWDSSVDAPSLIASLVAWHCNTVQAYALYYRPEQAPPTTLLHWPSLSNLDVARATIETVIGAAHAVNMPVGFFQATGEAYSDWSTKATGPDLAMGSFTRRCSPASNCRESDMDRSPAIGAGWNTPPQNYGWQADHLDLFDLCNAAWQRTLIENSIRPMLGQFPFDFWQADTLGAPTAPNYGYLGNPIDTGACLSDFTSSAQSKLGKPIIVNTVSGWGADNVAHAGKQPYQYRETWNYDAPSYARVIAISSETSFDRRRSVVQPAYLNRTLATECSTGRKKDGCTVNGNAALLATAAFAMSGSTFMNHADDGCIVTNVFIEVPQLTCTPAVLDALLAYKAFEVGYQHLLRRASTDDAVRCVITGGAAGSATGAAGKVYVLAKTTADVRICHLLNLTGVSADDWTDLDGAKEKPRVLTNVAMRMYYSGKLAASSTDTLWWASPDVAQGAARVLSYATGSDGSGRYISFTVPSLSYWDMIAFEPKPGHEG